MECTTAESCSRSHHDTAESLHNVTDTASPLETECKYDQDSDGSKEEEEEEEEEEEVERASPVEEEDYFQRHAQLVAFQLAQKNCGVDARVAGLDGSTGEDLTSFPEIMLIKGDKDLFDIEDDVQSQGSQGSQNALIIVERKHETVASATSSTEIIPSHSPRRHGSEASTFVSGKDLVRNGRLRTRLHLWLYRFLVITGVLECSLVWSVMVAFLLCITPLRFFFAMGNDFMEWGVAFLTPLPLFWYCWYHNHKVKVTHQLVLFLHGSAHPSSSLDVATRRLSALAVVGFLILWLSTFNGLAPSTWASPREGDVGGLRSLMGDAVYGLCQQLLIGVSIASLTSSWCVLSLHTSLLTTSLKHCSGAPDAVPWLQKGARYSLLILLLSCLLLCQLPVVLVVRSVLSESESVVVDGSLLFGLCILLGTAAVSHHMVVLWNALITNDHLPPKPDEATGAGIQLERLAKNGDVYADADADADVDVDVDALTQTETADVSVSDMEKVSPPDSLSVSTSTGVPHQAAPHEPAVVTTVQLSTRETEAYTGWMDALALLVRFVLLYSGLLALLLSVLTVAILFLQLPSCTHPSLTWAAWTIRLDACSAQAVAGLILSGALQMILYGLSPWWLWNFFSGEFSVPTRHSVVTVLMVLMLVVVATSLAITQSSWGATQFGLSLAAVGVSAVMVRHGRRSDAELNSSRACWVLMGLLSTQIFIFCGVNGPWFSQSGPASRLALLLLVQPMCLSVAARLALPPMQRLYDTAVAVANRRTTTLSLWGAIRFTGICWWRLFIFTMGSWTEQLLVVCLYSVLHLVNQTALSALDYGARRHGPGAGPEQRPHWIALHSLTCVEGKADSLSCQTFLINGVLEFSAILWAFVLITTVQATPDSSSDVSSSSDLWFGLLAQLLVQELTALSSVHRYINQHGQSLLKHWSALVPHMWSILTSIVALSLPVVLPAAVVVRTYT